jgi:hypothetical protein
MTARWFNRTLQDPPKQTPPPRRDQEHHNELLVKVTGSGVIEKFNPVALTEEIDTDYNSRYHKAIDTDINEYNWIILQGKVTANRRSVEAVYYGITFASVNILDVDHKYVTIEDNALVSANRGKGQILVGGPVGQQTIFISIGNMSAEGGSLFRFELTESLIGGDAAATIYDMDGVEVSTATDVYDPEGIFSTLGNEDTGLAILQGGKYYVIQAPCPPDAPTTSTEEPTSSSSTEVPSSSEEPTTSSEEESPSS